MYHPMDLPERLQRRSLSCTFTKETTTSTLGKYFEVSGNAGATAADTKIIVKGDVKKVKYLGFKMSAGELVVEGSMDQYAGGLDDRRKDAGQRQC